MGSEMCIRDRCEKMAFARQFLIPIAYWDESTNKYKVHDDEQLSVFDIEIGDKLVFDIKRLYPEDNPFYAIFSLRTRCQDKI